MSCVFAVPTQDLIKLRFLGNGTCKLETSEHSQNKLNICIPHLVCVIHVQTVI